MSVPKRWTDASAVLGGVVWLAAVIVEPFGRVEWLLALAPLVLVPLCLGLVATPARDGTHSRFYRLAVFVQPPAAVLAVASLALDAGILAGALAVPWLSVTLSIALFGLIRFLPRGVGPIEELAIDAGLLYVAVGGAWLLVNRLGYNPLEFGDAIVLFTAVHFHYAGFVLPILAGLAGRVLAGPDFGATTRRAFAAVIGVIIVGPGLIAAGITLSPVVEVVAVTALTVAVAGFALLSLVAVVPAVSGWTRRTALSLSALAVSVSMAFALGYGISAFTGTRVAGIAIDTMVRIHGHLNALGFALLGVLGWRIGVPPSRAVPPGIPFSRLTSRGRVGAEYRERTGVAGDGSPVGQVETFAIYDRPDFDSRTVHPEIRRFYERTGEYELSYEATWHRGFRTDARVAGRATGWLEQLNLPAPGAEPRTAASRIADIADDADGREGVRAWVRTDREPDARSSSPPTRPTSATA